MLKKKNNSIATNRRASYDYKIGDKMLIYNTFDKAFITDPQSFTNPKGLYNYFKTFFNVYYSTSFSYIANVSFTIFLELHVE